MSDLKCDDCGCPNPVWFAPNAIWNFVMGGAESTDDPGGIICPNCFIIRAENAGLEPTAWTMSPEDMTAAARAEKAEAMVREMGEALAPFAKEADAWSDDVNGNRSLGDEPRVDLTINDLRIARAALRIKEG